MTVALVSPRGRLEYRDSLDHFGERKSSRRAKLIAALWLFRRDNPQQSIGKFMYLYRLDARLLGQNRHNR